MFAGISGTATHFAITVTKNMTGNKLYALKLPCEKNSFQLVSKSFETFCKFQAWPNLIYKARSGMQKNSVQTQRTKKTKMYVRLRNSNCLLLFIT